MLFMMSDRGFIKWSVAIDWKQFTLSLTTGEDIFLTFSYLSTSELIIIKQRRREKKYLSQLSLSDISLSAVFENNSETCFEMEGDTMYVISMYSCETVSLALRAVIINHVCTTRINECLPASRAMIYGITTARSTFDVYVFRVPTSGCQPSIYISHYQLR